MNKDAIKGNWKQVKGALKKQWGDLTDDEMTKMEGNYDQIVGGIQKKYGYSKDEAATRVNQLLDGMNESPTERH